MKEVVLINYTGSKGGGALYALEMAKSLIAQNISCVAIIASHNENLADWKKIRLEKLVVIETYQTKLSLIVNSILFNKSRKIIIQEFKQYKIVAIFVPMITFWSQKINSIFTDSYKILTLHDPKPHSGEFYYYLQNLLGQQKLIRESNTIIVLSSSFISDVEERYNKKSKVIYLPMGDYDYYDTVNITEAGLYNDDIINFVFFGRISKYKGLSELGEAYKNITKITDKISLTVAGSGDFKNYEKTFNNLLNVKIVNEWIPDNELKNYFVGKNLVAVLPYLDATQSGVIQICKSFGVPVIASNTGGLKEQLLDYQTASILVEPGNSKDLETQMAKVIQNQEFKDNLFYQASKYESTDNWKDSAIEIKRILENN
ncbi:glycosyltransferase [Marinilactibacillus sp. XAAS-LB27]|uniref:glycosyltransferase n=1 Tax=Marinilactibacillus sp. XAAS-LB27 TaxID=3114538 RepID=UPI002E178B70|nr:glycosyltransferase [Marinilactibacillus sp. XAAS-LB27]